MNTHDKNNVNNNNNKNEGTGTKKLFKIIIKIEFGEEKPEEGWTPERPRGPNTFQQWKEEKNDWAY
ncbi:MAG: hypothetical protein QW303_01425 [Nitrososphaerota archaeon]